MKLCSCVQPGPRNACCAGLPSILNLTVPGSVAPALCLSAAYSDGGEAAGNSSAPPPAVTASSLRMAKWMRDYAALMRYAAALVDLGVLSVLACGLLFVIPGAA